MAEVIWSPRAVKDINEIAEYIAKDSFQYAKAQTNLFLEQAKGLENYSHRGRVVPEIGKNNVRQILCGHYRIIYEVVEKNVNILTVHHQARQIKSSPSATIKRYLRKK
jgi:toxin ParE1/3/4